MLNPPTIKDERTVRDQSSPELPLLEAVSPRFSRLWSPVFDILVEKQDMT